MQMASLAATNWPKPLVLVPCLSWSSAAPVFTTVSVCEREKYLFIQLILTKENFCLFRIFKGVMSNSINWDNLEAQYYSDNTYHERLSKMVSVIDDAFVPRQNFLKNFNHSLLELTEDLHNAKPSFNRDQIFTNDDQATTILLNNNNNASNNNGNCTHNKSNNQSKLGGWNLFDLIEEFTFSKLSKSILPNINVNRLLLTEYAINRDHWWENEALQFMRGIMDECTHLKNFSIPYDTSLAICVCALDDAYVPREGCSSIEDIWPGVDVRYLNAGHVSAYLLHQRLFR